MDDPSTLNVMWWVTAVELPALAGLFWQSWRNRRDSDSSHAALRRDVDDGMGAIAERLSAYKLEVAKSYAAISDMKDVERRLTEHLVRIERKLDKTAASSARGGER